MYNIYLDYYINGLPQRLFLEKKNEILKDLFGKPWTASIRIIRQTVYLI